MAVVNMVSAHHGLHLAQPPRPGSSGQGRLAKQNSVPTRSRRCSVFSDFGTHPLQAPVANEHNTLHDDDDAKARVSAPKAAGPLTKATSTVRARVFVELLVSGAQMHFISPRLTLGSHNGGARAWRGATSTTRTCPRAANLSSVPSWQFRFISVAM